MDWAVYFCIVFSISSSAGHIACLHPVPILKQGNEMEPLFTLSFLPKKGTGPELECTVKS